MTIPKGFWKNSSDTRGFAACDNRNCPSSIRNGGNGLQDMDTYQNGRATFCEACIDRPDTREELIDAAAEATVYKKEHLRKLHTKTLQRLIYHSGVVDSMLKKKMIQVQP